MAVRKDDPAQKNHLDESIKNDTARHDTASGHPQEAWRAGVQSE
jgi:hypothetical protein